MEFWKKLGFDFDPKFTDEKAGALVLGENIYAMLLTEAFFKSFIKKEIADSSKSTEVINAISADSKEEVDQLVQRAYDAGAKPYRDPDEYEWMYSRSFEDPDGHLWEVVYTDLSKFPKQ